jgi:hypothetical protein
MGVKPHPSPLLRTILNNFDILINTQTMTHNAYVLLIPLDGRAFSLGHLVRFHDPSHDLEIGYFSLLTDTDVSSGQNHGQSWVICQFP